MRFADIQTLDAELRSLVGKVRRGLVEFLRRLDIFDREQAFAALACSSTWEYLVRNLHLAEGTAYRRLTAMRLIRKFPQLEVARAEGLLNTTQLGVLSSVLTAENVDDLVRRATHLSKRETEELVVAIRGRFRRTGSGSCRSPRLDRRRARNSTHRTPLAGFHQ